VQRLGWLLALAGLTAGLVACSSNQSTPAAGTQGVASVTAPAAVGASVAPQAVASTPASAPATASIATAVATPTATAAHSPAPATAVAVSAPATATVSLDQPPGDPHGWGFMPAMVTVKAGGSVTWTNPAGNEIHTVTADDGSSFDSGVLNAGDHFSHSFAAAGSVPYHCSLHPWMKGVVQVVP